MHIIAVQVVSVDLLQLCIFVFIVVYVKFPACLPAGCHSPAYEVVQEGRRVTLIINRLQLLVIIPVIIRVKNRRIEIKIIQSEIFRDTIRVSFRQRLQTRFIIQIFLIFCSSDKSMLDQDTRDAEKLAVPDNIQVIRCASVRIGIIAVTDIKTAVIHTQSNQLLQYFRGQILGNSRLIFPVVHIRDAHQSAVRSCAVSVIDMK